MASGDGKYFATTKKGEIHEFKEDLRALDRSKKKEAVKKVIAAMTVGKDVSMLFPDVVNCMQTDDLELKKLVYLYLINYAKTQPDLAIMAVNTFVKDSQDPNPLIRALAVRTMGCIRVDKITEYLCDPLQRCLKDDDPYVRKTAAVCVAKLYDINPELVEDRGFLDALKDLLADSNPMVVANAVAALAEIHEVGGSAAFHITSTSLFKLLRALNECTEWGQVFILDSLAGYTARDAKDAESIVERVTPRLQHANCAVVLSAVKVILKQMAAIGDEALNKALMKKMAPPLVTLLSGEPEIQYVALRNISLIVQQYPQILSHEVKVFFCKYNDPIYVKMEKLEIMIALASDRNVDQVLLEFKEYATEVDVDFVRKAVRAIGRCAVSLERAAERCINVLLELIQTKVAYVVQEAVVVIKDIFRRYPNRYESVIATLCECLDTLDEPEARAAMVWVIGEYAERIDNADELLEGFLESFPEEPAAVQLQLVTAAVKLFLKKPQPRAQQMIQLVLTYATQETDNPDLRDRAFIYWRLLSTDPEAARAVVLSEKPVIADTATALEPSLLSTLLANLSTLASVYHKPPEAFVSRTRLAVQRADELAPAAFEDDSGTPSSSSAGGGGAGAGAGPAAPAAGAPGPGAPAAGGAPAPPSGADLLGDLLELDSPAPAPAHAHAPAHSANGSMGLDLLGGLGGLDLGGPPAPVPGPPPQAQPAPPAFADPFAAPAPAPFASSAPPAAAPLPVLLPADKGKGLALSGQLARANGGPVFRLAFSNSSAGALDGFMIQFNRNSFGLAPAAQAVPLGPLPPGGSATVDVPLAQNAALLAPGPATALLQVAVRSNQLGVAYFNAAADLGALLLEGGALEPAAFVPAWKALPDGAEAADSLPATLGAWPQASAKLAAANVFTMAHKAVPGSREEVAYLTARAATLPAPTQLLLELRWAAGAPGVRAAVRSERSDFAPMVFAALRGILGG
ncbi:hypothetical protein WJX81_000273 [Elliptochloris bilobata]|uniref:Beta-adaptin-like protein n=1 Tax=Elliptochloris bilobata TaxID=381761 RepID=A0AAW1S794_9CHLO